MEQTVLARLSGAGLAYLKAYLQVLAVLAAATELAAETLVDVAPTFIRAVPAVVLAVAQQRLGHAAAAAAQELRRGVAFVLCGGRAGGRRAQVSGGTRERGGGRGAGGGRPTRLTRAGAVRVLGGLVTLVVAVVLTVALPLAGAQAAPVGAAELVGAAGWVLCVCGVRGTMRRRPGTAPAPLGRGPVPSSHGTHRTRGTRRSHRRSPGRGRTRNAWECTYGSGT